MTEHPDFRALCAELATRLEDRIDGFLHSDADWELLDRARAAREAVPATPDPVPVAALNIVFDGPPGPEGGRFVEVETDNGLSINAGEWSQRPDGLWSLKITSLDPSPEAQP